MGFAIAGAIAAIIGTAVSTYAAFQQAETQREAAKGEARFREAEAESVRQSAAFEERQFRRRINLLLGKQRAIAAASGTDPSSGSPLLAELDNVRQAELEALNIRRTGEVGASSREFEARLAKMRAGFLRTQGQFALGEGALGASTSVLGGLSSFQKTRKSSTGINPNRVQGA